MNQAPSQNVNLQAALDYFSRGWSVLPLRPNDKKPFGDLLPQVCKWPYDPERPRPFGSWSSYQTYRARPEALREYFESRPAANVGIVTGAISGLIVLDCDRAEGMDVIEQNGGVPETLTSLTSFDGDFRKRQFYFQHPGFSVRNFARKLPGLDLRGDGGYVAAPPSLHPSGVNYEWLNPVAAIVPPPDWLRAFLVERPKLEYVATPVIPRAGDDNARKWVLAALEGEVRKIESVGPGQRHEQRRSSAIAIGGFIPSGAIGFEEAREALMANVGDDPKKAKDTVEWGLKSGMNRPREIPESSNAPLELKGVRMPPTAPPAMAIDGPDPFAPAPPIAPIVPSIPQSDEAEAAFLGSIFIGAPMSEAVELMAGEQFYRERNRAVWQAMEAVWGRGEAVDLVTVIAELTARGTLEIAGGGAYLGALIQSRPDMANIAAYARPVRNSAELRAIANAAGVVWNEAQGPGADADEMLKRLEAVVLDLQAKREQIPVRGMEEVLGNLMSQFGERRRGIVPGVLTGFRDLDNRIGGLPPGKLTTIAARPGMGKSAYTANIVEHIGRSSIFPVVVFSLEMDAESLVERMVSGTARVDGRSLTQGTLADWEWDAVAEAVGKLHDLRIVICDANEMTVMQMRAKLRSVVAQYGGVAAFAVDYLQIVDDDDHKSTRQEVIRRQMQTFRKMAKECGCPGIIVAQLNRECEKRESKRPVLSDLAEADAIGAESFVVQFIFREAYYRKAQEEAQQVPGAGRFQSDAWNDSDAEIIISKNRGGPTGVVRLRFVGEFARFENLAP